MKIIHTGDIHLGAPLTAHFDRDRAEMRRVEICSTFRRLVAFAQREGVRLILLAGDIFDGEFPLRRDEEFFYEVIKSAPQIDFLYLRGNHDRLGRGEKLSNLKSFDGEWRTYDYGEVTVSGIELNAENSFAFYNGLRLEARRKNIVMLHGQVAPSAGAGLISLNALTGKGIDYLALGHLHSFRTGRLDGRGVYAYCGCLEGRGYDETGEKGFVLLDTEGRMSASFVPFATRTIHEKEVDVGGLRGVMELLEKVRREASVGRGDILRLTVKGEAAFDTAGIEEFLKDALQGSCFGVSVKNRATAALDLSKYEGQVCLEAEFIRVVKADPSLTEEEKTEVIRLGLKALSGGRSGK